MDERVKAIKEMRKISDDFIYQKISYDNFKSKMSKFITIISILLIATSAHAETFTPLEKADDGNKGDTLRGTP